MNHSTRAKWKLTAKDLNPVHSVPQYGSRSGSFALIEDCFEFIETV